MIEIDKENPAFKLALELINTTSQHLFISGKAGSGKTTFLKLLELNTQKKMIIAAPTGVAAVNAGGITLHSLFNLPLVPYISENFELYKKRRLDAGSRKIVCELELLVIDEASMLRADTLDAIDSILRLTRNESEIPFGGVQIVFIGDLYQLPPVVVNQEKARLSEIYPSMYFVDATVYQLAKPINVVLDKIYRQSDTEFISILNAVRNNDFTRNHLERLNRYYSENEAINSVDYITLTTHNVIADRINKENLETLNGKPTTFHATITGNFEADSYPTDKELNLKEGAKVMLLKNDREKLKKYYNGKIGVLEKIEPTKLWIRFDTDQLLEIEEEIWTSSTYQYIANMNEIRKVDTGSFQQFPVRLAWAITIHKSQGLTFERALVDVKEAFAPGQVYVALSRLVSLNGLILKSPVSSSAVLVHERVQKFVADSSHSLGEADIRKYQKMYLQDLLLKSFNLANGQQYLKLFDFNEHPFETLQRSLKELSRVAANFCREIREIIADFDFGNSKKLSERVCKAADYFLGNIRKDTELMDGYIKQRKNELNYNRQIIALKQLQKYLEDRKHRIQMATRLVRHLNDGISFVDVMNCLNSQQLAPRANKKKTEITGSGTTQSSPELRTLELFRKGKTVKEIATITGFGVPATEHHLALLIKTGDVDILELIDSNVLEKIKVQYNKGNRSMLDIRKKIGDAVSFGQINAAITYFNI